MSVGAKRLSDQCQELFHYTTVPAFEKIYTSRKFWATHYEDLNDSSELQRFRLKVSKFAAPIIREIFDKKRRCDTKFDRKVSDHGGLDVVVDQEAAKLLDILHQNTFGERGFQGAFICSFCAHVAQNYEAKHGLLSQWRGYGTGGGVAIVLNTSKIKEKMKHEKSVFAHPMNHIGEVKYDDDHAGIEEAFHKVFKLLPGILHAFYAGQEPSYDTIFHHFAQGSTLVKHHGFREENEVRIVVSPRPTNPDSIFYNPKDLSKPTKKIRYRQRGDGEIRYIELFGKAPLPIKRIIVGPSRIQNLNYQTIRDLVADLRIEVVKSEIPFSG